MRRPFFFFFFSLEMESSVREVSLVGEPWGGEVMGRLSMGVREERVAESGLVWCGETDEEREEVRLG